MRNTFISLITLVVILAYTLFSYLYIDSFVDNFDVNIDKIQQENHSNKEIFDDINKEFENKKNMLILMISNEHISNIENYLTSLNVAIEFEDKQNIINNKNLLQNTIEDVKKENYKLL